MVVIGYDEAAIHMQLGILRVLSTLVMHKLTELISIATTNPLATEV